jgi:hypothetical protein
MNWRLPVGFIVAPVVPCILIVVPGMVQYPEWTGAWLVIAYMVIASLLITLLLGVPLYFALRRFWKVGLPQCVFSGALLGALMAALATISSIGGNYSANDAGGPTVIAGQYTVHGWIQSCVVAGQTALLGGGIGFMFWAVAIWRSERRPDEA